MRARRIVAPGRWRAAIRFPRPCPLTGLAAAGDAAGAAVTGAAVTTGAAVGIGGYAKKLLP